MSHEVVCTSNLNFEIRSPEDPVFEKLTLKCLSKQGFWANANFLNLSKIGPVVLALAFGLGMVDIFVPVTLVLISFCPPITICDRKAKIPASGDCWTIPIWETAQQHLARRLTANYGKSVPATYWWPIGSALAIGPTVQSLKGYLKRLESGTKASLKICYTTDW